MFKFSLKDIYDDKVGNYLLLIDLCKWASIIGLLSGIFLTYWFSHYWLAIIGGIFLIMVSSLCALIAHFVKKKLTILVIKGGNLVESTEQYLTNQAKQGLQKVIKRQHKKQP